MRNIINKLQALFVRSKNRAMLFLIFCIVAIGVIASVYYIHHVQSEGLTTASISSAPEITSLPGIGKSSNRYVDIQNNQNKKNAIAARKNFTSSVPTITRPNFKGSLSQFYKSGENNKCPLSTKLKNFNKDPAACTLHNLKLAKQAGVTAEELACQDCSCPVIREAGYSAGSLKEVGYSATQLRACGFTLQQLIAAGYSAKELKNAGFTAAQLKNSGFTSAQLKAAGFTAAQLKKAGFTTAQLKSSGFTAAQLKKAGFPAAQLKAAGFNAAQLKNAGFDNKQLSSAGFTPSEIASANGNDTSSSKICSVSILKKEKAEGYTAKQLRAKGCGLAALKAGGYTAKQLKAAGFTAAQLKAAGFTAAQLKKAGFSAAQLKAAGFSANQLKKAGFTAAQLKNAGFNAAQLHAAGFKAADLAKAGFTAKQLADAGLTAAQLKAAGFSPEELKHAGFTKGDLLRAGFTPAQAGFVSPSNSVQQNPLDKSLVKKPVDESHFSGQEQSTIPSADANSPQQQMARLARMQQQQMTMQQHQDEVAQMQSAMASMSQKLLAGWSTGGQQKLTATPKQKLTDQDQQCEVVNGLNVCGKNISAAVSGINGNGVSGNSLSNGPILKAGSIMFAVLQTSIDSDDTGTPIMAKIVTGRLKGAKLMGSFTRIRTHLVMRFTLLNDPNYPKSIAINSYAIDPDTARTALSGSVNEHYLQRYGTLFASSFLEGIGDAFQSSTNGMSVWHIGGASIPVIVKNPPNATQAALIGLGKVGSKVGQNMSNIVNRAPTVKISSGTGVGILIMSDLHLPAGQINATNENK